MPPAVPFAESRRLPPLAATEVLAAGGIVAFATSFALSPHHIEDGPVLCPFRRVTGLPCPGCGLTRSWVYLSHGWWRDSVVANPFGVVLVLLVLALAVTVVRARLRHAPAPDLDGLVARPWARVVIGAWLAFAVVRVAVDLA